MTVDKNNHIQDIPPWWKTKQIY